MGVNTRSSTAHRRLSEAKLKSYYGTIEQDDLFRFSPNIFKQHFWVMMTHYNKTHNKPNPVLVSFF